MSILLDSPSVLLPGPSPTRPARPCPPTQLLAVFKAAFATTNPRLVEPALSCLHKLVGGPQGLAAFQVFPFY